MPQPWRWGRQRLPPQTAAKPREPRAAALVELWEPTLACRRGLTVAGLRRLEVAVAVVGSAAWAALALTSPPPGAARALSMCRPMTTHGLVALVDLAGLEAHPIWAA